MTDERDPRVSQRYRELGREEPPGELDAGILAASRRAAKTRLAPLVPPTGRRHWYFPAAAAAIITLAVAVTLHMERQQLDPEFSGLRPEPPEAKKEPLAAAPPQESPAKPSAPREFARQPDGGSLIRRPRSPPSRWRCRSTHRRRPTRSSRGVPRGLGANPGRVLTNRLSHR